MVGDWDAKESEEEEEYTRDAVGGGRRVRKEINTNMDEDEGVSVITFSFGGFYFFFEKFGGIYFFSAKTKQTTPGAWWGPQAGLWY